MTTELTKAAQQALEQLEFLNACYPHKTAADAIAALQSALTQRPAAQEVATVTLSSAIDAIEHVSAHNGPGREDEAIAMLHLVNDPAMRDRVSRATLPAPQQATPEPAQITSRQDFTLDDTRASWARPNAAFVAECEASAPEPVARSRECTDPMCACMGGPCAECPEGEREKEIADLRTSRDFYKRRADALQQAQSRMRDPERTMVCDILANGALLAPTGDRYAATPEPVGEHAKPVAKFDENKGRPVLLEGAPMLEHDALLYTRPAPGVPEDVLAILDECRNALMECDRDGDYALIDRIDALAAAQAKGGV